MSQYQTFPDAPGHSRTLDKLKALRLPAMGGLRFLDVGCNEGFFCGFAQFDGASRSVGIDSTAIFIDRARARFPGCEFLQQGWDQLPEGPFDVILLASAIHYADDQPALVRSLMSRLAKGGVLVLELGIVSSDQAEWTKVERGIDERWFPSLPMLKEMLQDYAWKWIGPSVSQQGDPVQRHVVHVQHKRPLAYLLMQPPGFGKTSIARSLFADGRVRIVSGDQVLLDVAEGRLSASPKLVASVAEGFSSLEIDRATERVFDAGAGEELAGLWVNAGGGTDFAVDAFVPTQHQERVGRLLDDLGYLPVTLVWERGGISPASGASVATRADAYFDALVTGSESGNAAPKLAFKGTVGFVDEAHFTDGRMVIKGWAMHESGVMPSFLGLKVGRRMHLLDGFERQQRPDVQAHLGLMHDMCGFRAVVPLQDIGDERVVRKSWSLHGGNDAERLDGPFGVPARDGSRGGLFWRSGD